MDIFVFDNQLKKLKKIISTEKCVEAFETLEINKAGQLSLRLLLDYRKDVQENDILAIYKGKDNEYRLYRAIKVTTNNDSVEVFGLEYAYYALKVDGYIQDIRPKNEELSSILGRVLDGSGWGIGKVDKTIAPFTGNFYYSKRLDALAEIAEKLACEFEFVVTIANNKITAKKVNALDHIGVHTGKRFEYGVNALEIVEEKDATNVFHRAVGRGKGEETGKGYGRRINFTSVEWKKSKGDPVDKPKGQEWVDDGRTGNELPEGRRPIEIVVFEEETEPAKLLKKTYKWLLKNNRPKVQFKAKIEQTGELNLGDYVNIIRSDIGIHYETRVFKVNRNLLNERLNEIELGDKVAKTPMDKLNTVSKKVTSTVDNIQRVREEMSILRENGVSIFYGANAPVTKKKGDIWYKDTADGETIIMRYDGENWVEEVSDKVIEEIEKKVKAAEQDTKDAKERAERAVKEANDAIAKAERSMTTVAKLEDDTGKQFTELKAGIEGFKVETVNQVKGVRSHVDLIGGVCQMQSYALGAVYPNGDFSSLDFSAWYAIDGTPDGVAKISEIDKCLELSTRFLEKANARLKYPVSVNRYSPFLLKFKTKCDNDSKKEEICKVKILEYNLQNELLSTSEYSAFANASDATEKSEGWQESIIGHALNEKTQYVRIIWEIESSWSSTTWQIKDILIDNGGVGAAINLATKDIDISISGEDMVSRINMTPAETHIYSNKIMIDGATTIADATIKSAMIESINASKITAGTLDASKITVKNLDVNDLAGNRSRFFESLWADNNSYSKITANGMRFFKESDGYFEKSSYLNIYSNELRWKTNEPQYHYISESTKGGLSNLTIGAVTGSGDNLKPASLTMTTSGYNNIGAAAKSTYVSGHYLFLGNPLTSCKRPRIYVPSAAYSEQMSLRAGVLQ